MSSVSNISEHLRDTLMNISDSGEYYTKVSRNVSIISDTNRKEYIVASIGKIEVLNRISDENLSSYEMFLNNNKKTSDFDRGMRTLMNLRNDIHFMISFITDTFSGVIELSSISIKYENSKYNSSHEFTFLDKYPIDHIRADGLVLSEISEIHISFEYKTPAYVEDFMDSYLNTSFNIGDISMTRKIINKIKRLFYV